MTGFKKTVNEAIKEMEDGGMIVLLKRGDKIPEGSYQRFKYLLEQLKSTKELSEHETDKLIEELFLKEEEFLYDLFDTGGFKKLFELYEQV